MEARTKIIAAVAVIMMCAAGLVGAGYAYTATTENSGNNAGAEYITLVQGETGAYNFVNGQMIYWDSVDKKTGATPQTKYTLSDTLETSAITGYKMVQIGTTFTLNPVFSQSSNLPNITIEIKGDGAGTEAFAMPTYPANAEIWMKTTCNGAYQYFKLTAANTFTEYTYGSAWEEGTGANINVSKNVGGTAYNPVSVDLYYGLTDANYAEGYTIDHTPGNVGAHPPQTEILNNAKLTFSIEVNKVNGFALNTNDATLSTDGEAANHTIALTAVLPTGWTGTINWVSSDPLKATVSATTGATITVTGVAAGTATITASIVHDDVTYTVSCAVTVVAP